MNERNHLWQQGIRQRGFTLISLLVALAVIAITAAIGTPAFLEIMQEIKLKNTARETMAGMRMARYRAINESQNFGFDATPGAQPKIFRGTDPTDASALIREIPLPFGIAAGGDFGVANDTFVIFGPDGSAGNEGDVVLANDNNHQITVSVRPASTGRISISKIAGTP